MLVGISSSFDLDASLDEFLVVLGEPFSTRWIIWQEEQSQESAEYCDETFDDELETY